MSALRVQAHGRVRLFTLDRPKANAIDATTSREMGRAFLTFGTDPESLVGVLASAGGQIFSAGWDLKAAAEGAHEDDDYGEGGFAGIEALLRINKPMIAAVDGMAVGGGFELLLACDLAVVARHAEFWFPETSLGNMADAGGVHRLPRRLPRAIALEMLLTGRRMSAEEAARWGLVNRVVEPGQAVPVALAVAETIACGAPLSIQAIKEVVRGTEMLDDATAFATIRERHFPTHNRMLYSADHTEGPRAFIEKRAPRWMGR